MNCDFDRIIDRHGSDAVKIEALGTLFGRSDLIPLWVADMDFESPGAVRCALEKCISQGLYGYSSAPESYYASILKWEKDINGLALKRKEIAFIPGIVRGISFAIQCFTVPGDRILIQPPVYMPFSRLVQENGRELVLNPLIYSDGNYSMNLGELDELCRDKSPRMFILCNPHNPSGRAWDRDTLSKAAEICKRYGVIVVSDEIHGDMLLFGNEFHSFSSVSEIASEISITFKAPSKTFNIAGLMSSYAIVKDESLRSKFFGYLATNEFSAPPLPAAVATRAAYDEAREWRLEMLRYIEGNVDFVTGYLAVNIPQIRPVRPQASFLVWLDCRGLQLGHDELIDLFVNKAGLALNDGEDFGKGGEGFMRLNVGCPRLVLEKALNQLKNALR